MTKPEKNRRTNSKKNNNRRLKLFLLAGIPIGLLLMVGGAYLLYRIVKNPEGFIKTAIELQEQGEYETAQDQYNRAIRYSRSGQARAELARRMIENLRAQSPFPVDKAQEAWGMLVGYQSHIIRFDPKDQKTKARMMQNQLELAQRLQAPWAWSRVADVAEMVLRRDPDDVLARKSKILGRLLRGKEKALVDSDYRDIRTELTDLREVLPNDPDIPYYIAMTLLQEADLLDQDYLQNQRVELIDQALQTMSETRETFPDDLNTAVRLLKVELSAIRVSRFEDEALVRQWMAHLREIEPAVIDGRDSRAAMTLAQLLQTVLNIQTYGILEKETPLMELTPESLEKRIMALAKTAAEAAPQDFNAKIEVATLLRRFGEQDKAVHKLEEIVDPANEVPLGIEARLAMFAQMRARFLLADIQLTREARAESEEQRSKHRKMVESNLAELRNLVNPRNPYLQTLEGRIAYLDGQYREAVSKLQEAADYLGRDTPQTILFTGLSLSQLGETGAAVETLSRYLSVPGTTAWRRSQAFQGLVSCAIRLNEFDQAIKIAQRFLEENPDNIEAQLTLGEALIIRLIVGGIDQQTDLFGEALSLLEPLADKGNRRAVEQLSRVYTAAGNLENAQQLLLSYLDKNPEDSTALTRLYQTATALGQPETARERILNTLDDDPDNQAGQYLRDALEGDDKWRAFIPQLISVAFRKDSLERRLGLYQILVQAGATTEADNLLAQLRRNEFDNRDVIETVFNDSLRKAQWQDAEAAVNQLKEISEEELSPLVLQARAALAKGNPYEAIEILKPELSDNVRYSTAWTVLGIAYRQSGDLYQAQTTLEKALKLKPNDTFTLRQLIAVCDARGFNYQALEYMRRALHFAPRDADMLAFFLNYLEAYDNPDQALDLRLRLASVQPENTDNRRAIARLFLRTRQPEKAKAVLDKLLADAPEDFANVVSLADFYANLGQTEQAENTMTAYLRSDQQQVTARHWVVYADMLRKLNSSQDKIENALQQAMKIETADQMRGSRAYAEWLLTTGKPEAALKKYNEIHAQTELPAMLINITRAHAALEDYKAAYDALQQYLDNEELTANIAFLKAQIEINLGRDEDARETLDMAVSLDPGNPRGYLMRARFNSGKADDDLQEQVRRDLEKGLEIRPNYAPARQMLAEWLFRRGQTQEALEHVKRLLVRNPKNGAYREMLARLYLDSGDTNALAGMLAEWEDMTEDNAQVKYWRARLAQTRGEWDRAAQYLADVYTDHPRFRRQYITSLLRAEKYAKAIETLDAVKAESGGLDYNLLRLQAVAYAGQGDQDTASALFKQAWELVPEQFSYKNSIFDSARRALDEDYWEQLLQDLAAEDDSKIIDLQMAMLDLARQNYTRAIDRLETLRTELKEEDQLYARTLLTLGNAYTATREHEKAQQYLMMASDALPEDPALLNNLAYEMAIVGKEPYKAISIAEQCLEVISSDSQMRAHALDTLGYAQYRANLLAHAETSLERSIKIKPMMFNHLHLGQVYLAQRKPVEARQMLERAASMTDSNTSKSDSAEIDELLEQAKRLEAQLDKEKDRVRADEPADSLPK